MRVNVLTHIQLQLYVRAYEIRNNIFNRNLVYNFAVMRFFYNIIDWVELSQDLTLVEYICRVFLKNLGLRGGRD